MHIKCPPTALHSINFIRMLKYKVPFFLKFIHECSISVKMIRFAGSKRTDRIKIHSSKLIDCQMKFLG